MASRLNKLRYGSLQEIQNLADGDVPMDLYEHRAVTLNLIDKCNQLVKRLEAAEVRCTDLEIAAGLREAELEGEFHD